jgi:glutaredoxin
MLDLVRTSLHRVITTPKGDALLPVRLPKDLARRLNRLVGEPICSNDELKRRRDARARLEELRSGRATSTEPAPKRTQAPVMVYFEGDRNVRMLTRIKETLDARGIAFTPLDIAGDETTLHYVMREARCKDDELPIVFVAGTAVGGYTELVAWDVAGKLAHAVFGT